MTGSTKMFPTFFILLFVFNLWSVSATPCCSLNYERAHEILLTHPAEQEIILVTFSEEDPGIQSDSISDKVGWNDKLSGEVVDSAVNKENSTIIAKSDPVATNGTQQLINNTTEALVLSEDVGNTTKIPKEV